MSVCRNRSLKLSRGLNLKSHQSSDGLVNFVQQDSLLDTEIVNSVEQFFAKLSQQLLRESLLLFEQSLVLDEHPLERVSHQFIHSHFVLNLELKLFYLSFAFLDCFDLCCKFDPDLVDGADAKFCRAKRIAKVIIVAILIIA